MNKMASFINHYRALGAQAAIDQIAPSQEKTAFLNKLIPKTRLGRVGAGIAAGIGAGAAYKGTQEEPSALAEAFEGGKDMLSNMSQEDIMGYINLMQQMNMAGPGGGGSLGYAPGGEVDPSAYALQDIPMEDSMGYMSPEEEQVFRTYYGGQY